MGVPVMGTRAITLLISWKLAILLYNVHDRHHPPMTLMGRLRACRATKRINTRDLQHPLGSFFSEQQKQSRTIRLYLHDSYLLTRLHRRIL